MVTSSFCSPSPLASASKEQCTLKCNYLLMFLFFYLYFEYHRVQNMPISFELLNNLSNCRNIHLSRCSLYICSVNINLFFVHYWKVHDRQRRTMYHGSCHNSPHLWVVYATDQRLTWQSILNLDYRLFCLVGWFENVFQLHLLPNLKNHTFL